MDRALLTVLLIAFVLLSAWGLLVGWRHRAQRQSDIAAPPAVPDDLGADLAEPLTGLYVSSTRTGSWQDRVVAHGLGRRAAATVRLTTAGVLLDRVGEDSIFIPSADLVAVGTAPGIAGKVMAMPDGILLLTWDLDGTRLDTGLRLDDLAAQADWVEIVQEQLRGRQIPLAEHIPSGTNDDLEGPA